MHILIINHEFPPVGGGAATASSHIAEELAKMGHAVTVLTSAFAGCPRKEQKAGYAIIRIPSLRKEASKSNVLEMLSFLLSSLWWVVWRGRAQRADVCIAFFGIPAGPAALLLKWLAGVPYIVSLRGGDVPGFLPQQLGAWHRLSGWLIRIIWSRAAAVVANSKGLARLAQQFALQQAIEIIPNGIDATAFENQNKTTHSGPVRLINTGRLNAQKNLKLLLDALSQLKNENWRMTFVGDGPERARLERQARSLGIYDQIDFLGWRPRQEMPSLLAKADVYVFPSIQEGMSNTVLEAMAAQLPVIACPIEGCEELVKQNQTGLLTPVDDKAALAKAVLLLMEDKALLQRLGEAGRYMVKTEFSWQVTAQAYDNFCQKAMLEKRKVTMGCLAKEKKHAEEKRFRFGNNWLNFLNSLTEERIRAAEASLTSMLGLSSLEGMSFLDIGSGSGLFSLAAYRLGASRVFSFDYAPDSVNATKKLQEQYIIPNREWRVEQGSVLDKHYMNSLDRFNIVYSWGVLHHTGSQWEALQKAADRVAPGGILYIALYNDQGCLSTFWTYVKKYYASGAVGKIAMTALFALPITLFQMTRSFFQTGNPLRHHLAHKERGMSPWHDIIDWIGGYPFEVSSPEQVFHFFKERGFYLDNLKITNGHGNNEFIFISMQQ